jgi:hypothetical protein
MKSDKLISAVVLLLFNVSVGSVSIDSSKPCPKTSGNDIQFPPSIPATGTEEIPENSQTTIQLNPSPTPEIPEYDIPEVKIPDEFPPEYETPDVNPPYNNEPDVIPPDNKNPEEEKPEVIPPAPEKPDDKIPVENPPQDIPPPKTNTPSATYGGTNDPGISAVDYSDLPYCDEIPFGSVPIMVTQDNFTTALDTYGSHQIPLVGSSTGAGYSAEEDPTFIEAEVPLPTNFVSNFESDGTYVKQNTFTSLFLAGALLILNVLQ